jgi:hypothetical protein
MVGGAARPAFYLAVLRRHLEELMKYLLPFMNLNRPQEAEGRGERAVMKDDVAVNYRTISGRKKSANHKAKLFRMPLLFTGNLQCA